MISNKYFRLLIFCFFPIVVNSQYITVDDTFSVPNLVTTKLINSPCASVENFSSSGGTFINDNKSFGYFEKGTSDFPFQNGILLTSSKAIRSVGPNNSILSEGGNSWAGDGDLEVAIGTSQTKNATVIEFDFTPLSSEISFNYIFASEEYSSNYPCTYSDGFAFLLKPAVGNAPYINLALIPNLSIPVSSKNIRPKILVAPGCEASNESYFNGYNPNEAAINYNGQTIVMTAKANVIAGLKYHIKLVVADQDDSNVDSAIFIEGGSFSIGASLGADRTLLGGNPVCGNTNIVLNGFIPGVNTYKWFKNNNLIVGAASSTLNVNENGVYKVEITVTGTTCIAESDIKIEFAESFSISPKSIKQCDTDLDLITDINLKQIEVEVIANPSAYVFKYYKTLLGANSQDINQLITNPTAYNNSNGNEVWLRVKNSYGCFEVIKITLVISATQLPPNYSQTISKCDDYIDAQNTDLDGISGFDFGTVTSNLTSIIPNPSNYQLKYYKNQNDFNQETDANGISLAITNTNNYRNIGYPNNQTIWIKVKSTLDDTCFGFGRLFLIVEKLPIANAVSDTRLCDKNPSDTILESDFDTSNIQNLVLGTQNLNNVDVTYFNENGTPLLSPLPNPFTTTTQKIKVRVTNKNGNDTAGKCFDETTIQFTVDKQPIANPLVVAKQCDTNSDSTIVSYGFNTSSFSSTILGNQTGFVVKYFDANNQLINPFPNILVSGTQTIRAVIENPLNLNCNTSLLINLKVNELPNLSSSITETFICSGTAETVIIPSGLLSGNIAEFSFKWFKNNVEIIGQTNENLTVNDEGTYVCEVTNIQTGCSKNSISKIVFSQIATITSLTITDLVDNNTLNVTVSGNGNYEYSIDEPDGPFQTTGNFANIEPGFHTLYINDNKGCGIVDRKFAIVGTMSFFTPNGDSFNDYWKIRGINAKSNRKSKVQIFDRLGKFITEIMTGESLGWDGTLNGKPLPADDYWFTFTLEDGRSRSGHFSLKR